MYESVLREFMNVYWLRPESAVWRALDVHTMRGFELRSPSLDFGCGDGLFSFIRALAESPQTLGAVGVADIAGGA